MKVHLIRKETIESYVASNARSKPSFATWLTGVKYADWAAPSDIKQTFGSADLSGNGSSRVVFDIGGNNYICWIGTHAEYDKLCDNKEQYTITNY